MWDTPRGDGATGPSPPLAIMGDALEQLQQVFAAAAPATGRKAGGDGGAGGAGGAGGGKTVVNLLDFKRSNNVAIGLAQFRSLSSWRELALSVARMDTQTLPLDKAEPLLELMPTDAEMRTVKAYRGPEEALGVAEQWFRTVGRFPGLQAKLQAHVYRCGGRERAL